MVVEQVEFNVADGREAEMLRYLAETRGAIDSAAGCRGYMFGRGVESPSKVMLVVTWDSLEAHEAARQRPEFAQFTGGLRAFITGAKAEHFAVAS